MVVVFLCFFGRAKVALKVPSPPSRRGLGTILTLTEHNRGARWRMNACATAFRVKRRTDKYASLASLRRLLPFLYVYSQQRANAGGSSCAQILHSTLDLERAKQHTKNNDDTHEKKTTTTTTTTRRCDATTKRCLNEPPVCEWY